MRRKLVLPILALSMLAFAVLHVVRAQQMPPRPGPPLEPARSPFGKVIAAAGIAEPRTENIAIGTQLAGIVERVFVKVGQRVHAGDPLFHLDDRHLQADLKVRDANLAAAQAQLARLEQMPRPEEVPATEARVREARAALLDQEDQVRRSRQMLQSRAIGEEEAFRRQQSLQQAQAAVARTEAEERLLKAGAWEADKAISRTALLQARAQLAATRVDLDRMLVKAPIDGEVLQVNVRPGEFVGPQMGQALIVLGDIHQLHVRVDIDEYDIPRFLPGSCARAVLRGHPQEKLELTFVRVEPYVIPKKSLTGDNVERVDTRVLQVLYALEKAPQAVYVGQQLDVFIKSGEGVR